MDYVIAYYPSIALFYKSKVAKRFDPSVSTEAMRALLFNVTGMYVDAHSTTCLCDVTLCIACSARMKHSLLCAHVQ